MLLKYITLLSGFNFFLLSIATLLKQAPNPKANRVLTVLMLLMAAYCGLIYFHYCTLFNHIYQSMKYYIPIDGLFLLLMGPSLYFYVLLVLNKPVRLLAWHNLLHAILLLPCIAYNIRFSLLSYEQRLSWLVRDFNAGTPESNFLNVILYLQLISYVWLCYVLVRKQLKLSDKVIIDGYLTDISWLKTFLIVNVTYLLLSAPVCFYFANERTSIVIGQLAMDIQFLYLFFRAVLHKDTYSVATEVCEKDAAFKINKSIADDYQTMLVDFMQEHKPYLDEDCNIKSVATQIGIPVHHLSISLNTHLKKAFPDFVNEYRVEEAKRLLRDPESHRATVESIGLDCGFGSKSSFNRVFKKYADNLTPSEYRRRFSQTL